MAFRRSGTAGGGTELASGFIALSVRYSGAMKEIQSDFDRMAEGAKTSGKRAGAALTGAMRETNANAKADWQQLLNDQTKAHENFVEKSAKLENARAMNSKLANKEITSGFESGRVSAAQMLPMLAAVTKAQEQEAVATQKVSNALKSLPSSITQASEAGGGFLRSTRYALDTAGIDMTSRANRIGSNIGYALSNAVGGGIRGIEKVASTTFANVENIAMRASGKISNIMADMLAPAKFLGPIAAIAGIGEILTKGFEHADAIETAKVRLEAFGATADQVNAIMKSISDATTGTAYDITDVINVANRGFAEGIQPGGPMTQYLKTVEDLAAITKQTPDQIAASLERAQNREAISMRDLNTYVTQGIPIRKWMEDTLHVTDEGFAQLLKDGKLTFADLMNSLEEHSKGGAEKMTETFGASMHRLGNDIGKLGGAVIEPFLGGAGGGFKGLLDKFDAWFGDGSGAGEKIKSFVDGVKSKIGSVIEFIKGTPLFKDIETQFDKVMPRLKEFGDGLMHFLGSDLKAIAPVLGAALGGIVDGVLRALPTVLHLAGEGLDYLGRGFDWLIAHAPQIEHAFGNFWHACENVWHAVENFGHALENTWHGVENFWHALENIWHAADNVWHAISNVCDFVNKAGDAVGNFMKVAGATIWESITTQVGGLAHEAENVWHAFQSAFEWVEKLINSIGNIPKNLGLTGGGDSNWVVPPGGTAGAHAQGGFENLPGQAKIQSAVYPTGLVQWAEPSTGGEAFIPLAGSKRKRALQIWLQTGKLLGMDRGGFAAAVPWGVDPHGSREGGSSAGPFGPWWDMDWMPPEHPEKVGPGKGRWWYRGPTHEKGIGGGALGPPIGKLRPPRPGDFFPGMIPDPEIKTWGFEDGGISAVHDFLSTLTGGSRTNRTPYQLGGFSPSGIDCSGLVSAVVNKYLGQAPFSSRTATGGEASWLTKHGFVMGNGPSGTLRVGWFNGGEGGGHTALTLPDGTNVESTTSHGISGVRVGPLAAGADSSQFSQHAYLPLSPAGGRGQTGGVPGTVGVGGGAAINPSTGVDYGVSPSVGSGQTSGVGGGQTGSVGGAPSQAQQEAEDKKERSLNDRIVGLNNDIATLEQKQSEMTDKTKQSEKDKVQNDIDGKRKELANAQSDLSQAQSDWNSKWSSAGGQPAGQGGGKGFDFGHLADTAMSGITETLLPPGFINPMDSPIIKGAAGILKFLSGLGQKHGGPLGGPVGGVLGLFGGVLGGSPSSGIDSLMQSFQPQAGGNIVPGSPGQAPYTDPNQLFGGSGGVGIVPGQLPGLNSVFPQGSPASGTGGGALPGPADGQGQGGNLNIHNDFSQANFQGDPGGVKTVLQDRDLSQARKHSTSAQRNDMPGAH